MAVLKDSDGSLKLAPLYDFGPSFLDARSIVRVLRWDGEAPGRRDWSHILGNFATRLEEAGVAFTDWSRLAGWMRGFARILDDLPSVMSECGVAPRIIQLRREAIVALAAELRAIKEI